MYYNTHMSKVLASAGLLATRYVYLSIKYSVISWQRQLKQEFNQNQDLFSLKLMSAA